MLTAREPSALSSYNLSVIADAMPPPLLGATATTALLRHIGNAPVHWHEETFSSGGILLSDENATVFLTSSDLQPVAPTQTATLNAICFFFDRIKIFQASIPQAERISYTVLFHALPVTLLSEDYRGQ